jgi:glycerol-3-phosphate dehydrogenase (NAD(P)+)
VNISVIGAGAYGTALALVLGENNNDVTLWGHNPAHLSEIAEHRENRRHVPGVPLPESLKLEPDLDAAVGRADALVVALPSRAFRTVTARLGRFTGPIVTTTKGIEDVTGLTMSGIIREAAPGAPVAALSGPSLAAEVARGAPTAVVAASTDEALAREVQRWFNRPCFRVYTSPDILGVELGGALKNVIAIAAGVCEGLGFGENSKAALVTRGQAELRRLGVHLGAKPETFYGLSGLGDLTVTCFSRHSRNRTFGEQIGRGANPTELLAAATTVVEGHPTARSAHQLAERAGVPCPIIAEVHAMLYLGKPARRAVSDLLNREVKPED